MSLKTKLYVLVAASIGLMILLATTAFFVRQMSIEQALAEQQRANTQILLAREAQVSFKKQVQEWKNLLLRGDQEPAYVHYFSAFVSEELAVSGKVQALLNSLTPEHPAFQSAEQFLMAHQRLGEAYRQALIQFKRGKMNTRQVDTLVRGIDRSPTDLFDTIVQQVQQHNQQVSNKVKSALSKTQWFIASIIFIAAVISTWQIVALASRLIDELTTDPLTGLFNRRELIRRIEHAIRQHRAVHLLSLDIDQFKTLNDTCGHSGADRYLKEIAVALKKMVRKEDLLFRSNADEFLIIAPHLSAEQAIEFGQRVRALFSGHYFQWQGSTFNLSTSVAIVALDNRYQDVESVFNHLDLALQQAKESGRNRVVIFNQQNKAIADRQQQMRMVHKINHALEIDKMVLYKQRIADIQQPQYCHFEVLIRMTNEDGDIIAPGAFLPAAEKYNVADKIDRWVIAKLFKYLNQNAKDQCHYSINLSGATLSDASFVDFIRQQFQQAQFDVSRIHFEITETDAVKHFDIASNILTQLKDHGCKISLDDFGSGVSSFSYLLELNIDTIKIDGAFILNMHNHPVYKAVVRSVVDIAATLHLSTVAEFVEDQNMVNTLADMGVNCVQGFGIHQPEPLEKPCYPLTNLSMASC